MNRSASRVVNPLPSAARAAGMALAALALLSPGLDRSRAAEAPPPESAAEARRRFDAAWGSHIAKVRLTRVTLDDAALAARMVRRLPAEVRSPAYERILCEKARELGTRHPSGYLAAIGALRHLGRLEPANLARYRDAIFKLHEELYARTRGEERVEAGRLLVRACIRRAERLEDDGDYDEATELYRRAISVISFVRAEKGLTKEEIQVKLRRAAAKADAAEEVDRLKNQLVGEGGDEEARQRLVHLYLVELDQPEKAEPYVPEDDPIRHFVVAATISHETLNARACRSLGDWYRELAEEASREARVATLFRAVGYYRAFLEKHPAKDTARTEVEEALDQLAARLARLPGTDEAPPVNPKFVRVSADEFRRRYAAKFPPPNNVARSGVARASSFYGKRRPENVFRGARTGQSWTLKGPKGTFEAAWDPPVRGRYLLLFNRTSRPGADPWGEAAIHLNEGRPFRLPMSDFSSHEVLIVDFGTVVRFASLRIAIDGKKYPGLAGLEIHR